MDQQRQQPKTKKINYSHIKTGTTHESIGSMKYAREEKTEANT